MSIHAKLLAIQSSLHVPKAQKNSFGNYNYRSCEDILESLKPLLKDQGCSITLSDEIIIIQSHDALAVYESDESVLVFDKELKKAVPTLVKRRAALGEASRFYVKATATLHDSSGGWVSSTAFAREEETKKGMDGAQITGAASSYARKYALNGLFCIDDTQDSDSMDNSQKAQDRAPDASAKTAKKPAAPPPAPVEDLNSHASGEQVTEIARLCKMLNGEVKTLYDKFKVKGQPTKKQAMDMIDAMKKRVEKLESEIDEAAKANS